MSIFLSHSDADQDALRRLIDVIQASDRQVWVDKVNLTGGDAWWPVILEHIRDCDVFVFAVTAESLSSTACITELQYAQAARRPVLPVQIGDLPDVDLRLEDVFLTQSIDYRTPTDVTGALLSRALHRLEASRPTLPEPLPPEPPVPFGYMPEFHAKLRGSDELSFADQTAMFHKLSTELLRSSNRSERASNLRLLDLLLERDEVGQRIALQAADLRAKLQEQDAAAEAERAERAERAKQKALQDEQRRADELRAADALRLEQESQAAELKRQEDERAEREAAELRKREIEERERLERERVERERAAELQRRAPVGSPAGWFEDPLDDKQVRYWDGAAWTEHVSPAATKQPPPPPRLVDDQRTPVPVEKPQSETLLSTLGIIFGLVAIIPYAGWIGIAGLVLSIMAIQRGQRRGGLALTISILGLVLGVVIIALIIVALAQTPSS